MGLKRIQATIDVVQAAQIRVRNIFANGLPVYLSFSAGKDSLCIAHLLLTMMQRGEIDPALLTVIFIDEEAIFPCIERTAMDWRKRFLHAGAQFIWYCVEVRHFDCFNLLEESESFFCWDSTKKDVWVRPMPAFAVRTHPLLLPRQDTYQDFLDRSTRDGLHMVGVRASESVQRLQYLSKIFGKGQSMSGHGILYPIYDWRDADVWLYLLRNGVQIPDIYLYLWQSGTPRNRLRVSQFFSSDTAGSLVKLNAYYPDLMERILRREPNAYLAAMYWDSEMFGRSTRARRELEGKSEAKNHKALLLEMFADMARSFPAPHQRKVAETYRRMFLQMGVVATDRDYRDMYEALVRGDPKLRCYRAIYQSVYARYAEQARKERLL